MDLLMDSCAGSLVDEKPAKIPCANEKVLNERKDKGFSNFPHSTRSSDGSEKGCLVAEE
jgi:hypothetical protein